MTRESTKRRVLVLPGTARPSDKRYQRVYETIENGATKCACECRTVSYPGQEGPSSGLLTYLGAVGRAYEAGRVFEPHWVIGRSLGCVIALAVAGMKEPWVERIEGVVLWGPVLGSEMQRRWGSDEAQAEQVRRYEEQRGTFLAADFYKQLPAIESVAATASRNLRIARGSREEYNEDIDLKCLESIHRRLQPSYLREVRMVEGVKHEVVAEECSPEALSAYLSVLFDPIAGSR